MRCIAVMNQKGGVGKTTTTANLGAALALQGRRVVVVDMDAQANLSLSLNVEAAADSPSSYTVLTGSTTFAQALRPTAIPRLRLVASHLDLSGAELELASTIGREYVMRDAVRQWIDSSGGDPADYVLFDCPPSLGLLSINALAASQEVLITLQTEFLALQGMSKLIDVVQLLRRRLNPHLSITGILPCLYDSRLKLAREVLGEIRTYFPGQVLPKPVRSSVKLAEAPSYGRTIFEYAPESNGAHNYMNVAREIIQQESRDPALAGLQPFDESIRGLPAPEVAPRDVSAPRATSAERAETVTHAKDSNRAESAARARAAKQVRAAQRVQAAARIDVSPAADVSQRAAVSQSVGAAHAVHDSPRVGCARRVDPKPSHTVSVADDGAAPKRASVRTRGATAVEKPARNDAAAPLRSPSTPDVPTPSPSKRTRMPIREIPAAQKPTASASPLSVPPVSARPISASRAASPVPLAPAKRTPSATAGVVLKPATTKSRVTTTPAAATPPVAPQSTSTPAAASQPEAARKARATKASASNTVVPAQPASEPRELPATRPTPSTVRPSLTRTINVENTAPRLSARAEDFPPLPPDAFEILTSLGREP